VSSVKLETWVNIAVAVGTLALALVAFFQMRANKPKLVIFGRFKLKPARSNSEKFTLFQLFLTLTNRRPMPVTVLRVYHGKEFEHRLEIPESVEPFQLQYGDHQTFTSSGFKKDEQVLRNLKRIWILDSTGKKWSYRTSRFEHWPRLENLVAMSDPENAGPR
jgi:hypothetical protein